jgi:hypothetical protein
MQMTITTQEQTTMTYGLDFVTAARPAPVTDTLPSMGDLKRLPVARSGTYELTPAQVVAARARVYALNKDNAAGWKWRTLTTPAKRGRVTLTIWRII